MQRRAARGGGVVHVGAVLDQQQRHLQVAQRGGPVQRCELRRRACVQVAAALEVL